MQYRTTYYHHLFNYLLSVITKTANTISNDMIKFNFLIPKYDNTGLIDTINIKDSVSTTATAIRITTIVAIIFIFEILIVITSINYS